MTLLIPLISQGVGLFAAYFPAPSGTNGLEDYVRAADAVSGAAFAPYVQWSLGRQDADAPPVVRIPVSAARWTPTVGTESTPRQRLRDERASVQERAGHWEDYLAYCAEVTERFGGILDLVRAGNAKALRHAPDLSDLQRQFESVTNVALAAAHLRFSQGSSKEGTAILLDQMEFLDNLERSEATYLPTLEGERAVLAAFTRHLDAMSLADCKAVSASAQSLLARPIAALDASGFRRAVWEANLRADVAEVVGPAYDPKQRYASPLSPSLIGRLRTMSDLSRTQAVEDALAGAIAAVGQTARSLSGPEATWERAQGGPSDPTKQWDDLPSYFAQRARMDAFPLLSYEIEFRTRVRLLVLSGRIGAYRFQKGRYPRSLSELGKGVETDPLNGQAYGFQRYGPTFEVWSRGLLGGKPIFLDPQRGTDEPKRASSSGT